jgi:hypothetical protein
MRCHGPGAVRTLGLAIGQLNREFLYESTTRLSNQLATLEHIGLFAEPLGKPVSELALYPVPFGDAPLDARARAYMHTNCSICHRPGGNAGRAGMDFRFSTALTETKACDVKPVVGDFGLTDAKILDPGRPQTSIVSLRVRATDGSRMPPLGSSVVDRQGADLLDAWIGTLRCP